jgi:hypothetical protein
MGAGMVAGIDWASEVHVACVMDGDAAGVTGVAIERGDGPVAVELVEAGLAVFVVPSRHIKGLRAWYGSAGNKEPAAGYEVACHIAPSSVCGKYPGAGQG